MIINFIISRRGQLCEHCVDCSPLQELQNILASHDPYFHEYEPGPRAGLLTGQILQIAKRALYGKSSDVCDLLCGEHTLRFFREHPRASIGTITQTLERACQHSPELPDSTSDTRTASSS